MNSELTHTPDIIVPEILLQHPELGNAYRAVHSAHGQALLKQLFELDPNLAITIAHAHEPEGGFRPLGSHERSVEINQVVHFEPLAPTHDTDRASVAWRMIADEKGMHMVACADCSTHGCGEGGDGTGDGHKPNPPRELPAKKGPSKPAPAITR